MVPFLDLQKVNQSFQPGLGKAVARVIESGWFIRGEEGRRFEEAYAAFTGTAHCVGVGNGFDALRLIFRAWLLQGAMREDDEVIVPANTYIASILAVTENRLKPVLVEPLLNTFAIDPGRIEEKITSRTKAILVVHLYGRNAMHPEIKRIADHYHLKLVEDNAQAAGCYCGDRRTGSLGDAAAHSFFPTKNLGALGDGGAVTMHDDTLASMIRTLGNYGSEKKGLHDLPGVNSRLDDVQAAVLSLKLGRLDEDNRRRRQAALTYLSGIENPAVTLPQAESSETIGENVWHLFVVRCGRRNALQKHLREAGIETLIHYPIPPHKQKVYASMNAGSLPITEQIHQEVLSLPLTPVMRETDLQQVAEAVNRFRA